MNSLDFIFIALAAWRLASLLVREDGPFDIFEKIRWWVAPSGELTNLGKLFSCVWCMSVWTAVLCYLVWLVWELPVILGAASALAIAFEEKLTK